VSVLPSHQSPGPARDPVSIGRHTLDELAKLDQGASGVQNIDIRLVEATDPPGWVRSLNSDFKAATVQAPLMGL
jgi:hypothetical protein